MGSSFAPPNHIGMPLVSPKLKLDFLRRQVLMSRNISGGPPISVCSWVELPDRAPPVPLHGATQTTERLTLGLGFSPTIRRARQEMQAPKPARPMRSANWTITGASRSRR